MRVRLSDLFRGHRWGRVRQFDSAAPAFLMTNLYCPSFSGMTLTQHFGLGESSLATSAPEES